VRPFAIFSLASMREASARTPIAQRLRHGDRDLRLLPRAFLAGGVPLPGVSRLGSGPLRAVIVRITFITELSLALPRLTGQL
jgi:hypothetical protein